MNARASKVGNGDFLRLISFTYERSGSYIGIEPYPEGPFPSLITSKLLSTWLSSTRVTLSSAIAQPVQYCNPGITLVLHFGQR